MKTLFVSLVAFLFALIIGCQESSITDPVSNDTETNSTASELVYFDKDLTSYYTGVIKLEGMLPDPDQFLNSFVHIKGTVRYRVDKIKMNEKTSPAPSAIKVGLDVNAQLIGESPKPVTPWTVNSSSEDVMYKSHSGLSTYVLEKSFKVNNTSFYLILNFKVYEKFVKLTSMELKKSPGSMQIPDPSF